MDQGGSDQDTVPWKDKNLHEINFSGESRLVTQVQGLGTGWSGQKEQMAMSCTLGNNGQVCESILRKQLSWNPSLGTLFPIEGPGTTASGTNFKSNTLWL